MTKTHEEMDSTDDLDSADDFDSTGDLGSTGDSGWFDRRTVLKGVAAGLVGTAGVGTASADENNVILEADDRPVEYRIEVSGRITKGEEAGANDRITDDGGAVVGVLEVTDEFDDRIDEYEFTGQITDFEVLQGSLKNVWVNGRRVNPADLPATDSSATVLEDFESGEWPGDWTDQTHQYRLTEDAIRGSYSLEATEDYPNVAKPTVSSQRGHSYSVRTVIAGGARAEAWLLTNVQHPIQTFRGCYVARLHPYHDSLHLAKYVDDDYTSLAIARTDLAFDTEYRLVCDVDDDRVRARVLDAEGTELAATSWVSDAEHAGGSPGLYTDGTGAAGTRYDDLTRHPLGEP